MNVNLRILAFTNAGVLSLAAVVQADEHPMSQVMTTVSSTTLSGYVDTSIIWKAGTGDANLPGRAFDRVGKLDGFNLNVVKLKLEKPVSDELWATGYKVSLLFGPDATGFNTSANATPGAYDFSVEEAYVDLRVPAGNGIDFKVGSFTTIIGYESFGSYLNPNYARSFGWQLEPTQHTGFLASYKASDAVSLSAGIANTWNAGINARATRANAAGTTTVPTAESEKTYMASISITAPDSWGFLS